MALKLTTLKNAVRNAMTIIGTAGTLGYFAGSKIFADVLGGLILAGMVYSLYFIQSRFGGAQ